MGDILIKNGTNSSIQVRVTVFANKGGSEESFKISSGASESWNRSEWQVAFVLREDNEKMEMFIVKPNEAYTVG